jgi:hypothetical protein
MSTLRRRRSLALPLSFLTLAAAARAQAPVYTVEFLGPAINAAAMNASGQVVGTVSSPATRGWVAAPGMPLTLLPLPPGRISSWANEINDGGAIAGAVGSSVTPEFGGVAAVWHPDGSGGYVVVELGTLPGHQRSNATALNDVGDVVGYSVQNSFRIPVLFAPGGVQSLLPTGIFDPRDVNDQRVVVDGSFTAKLLDLDTMLVTDLGVPTGLPSNYVATSAAAINESGQVCGQAILATSTDCDRQAARYSPGVGWQIFSSCGKYNGAVDMNDLGDVVMQLNVAPYVRFDGLGTFLIEDLIENTVGHWYVINGFGLAIDNARRMVVPAHNQVTGQSGLLFLTPKGDAGTVVCQGDGSAGACPCGNSSAPGGGAGCLHSGGQGAVASASGSASVAADDLVLHLTQAPAQTAGLLLQGALSSPLPLHDGLLCAGSPVIRLQALVTDGAGSASSSVSLVAAGSVLPGMTRVYQAWFRDQGGPCLKGSNFSAGLRIDWH